MSDQNVRSDIEVLMSKYGDLLFKTCVLTVKNKYDAEDIVQETMLKYYMADTDFKDDEHKKAWLLRVSQNMCKNLLDYRKRHAHISYEELEGCIEGGTSYSVGSMEEFLKIANLDYKYQSVIVLHYFEDLSVEEVADVLEISVSAVKMRLKRAREKLKRVYKKHYSEEVL